MNFIQQNGCPECQCLDIAYGAIVVEGVNATQGAVCMDCGHEWHDVYAYSYSVHEEGTSKHDEKEVSRSANI